MNLEKDMREWTDEEVKMVQTESQKILEQFSINLSDEVCDSCALMGLRDDPKDCGGEDIEVYCMYTENCIQSGLSPCEVRDITRPVWCPKTKIK